MDPKFADPNAISALSTVRKRVSETELMEDAEGEIPSSKTARRRATEHVRKKRLQAFIETAPVDPGSATSKTSTSSPSSIPTPSVDSFSTSPSVLLDDDSSMNDPIPIDPRLMDDEACEQASVSAESHQKLQDMVFASKNDYDHDTAVGEEGEAEEHEMEELGLEAMLTDQQGLARFSSRQSFMDLMVRIKSTRFRPFVEKHVGRVLSGGATRVGPKDIRVGNTRDYPTPFVYRCTRTKDCDFETFFCSELIDHETRCTDELVKKKSKARSKSDLLPCPKEGCPWTGRNKATLYTHIKNHE